MWDKIKGFFGGFGGFFAQVAQTAVGAAVEELKDVAMDIVDQIQSDWGDDVSGARKFNMAEDYMQDHFPDAQSAAINLAIEMAVAIVKDRF